jgi:hypothetical protein
MSEHVAPSTVAQQQRVVHRGDSQQRLAHGGLVPMPKLFGEHVWFAHDLHPDVLSQHE